MRNFILRRRNLTEFDIVRVHEWQFVCLTRLKESSCDCEYGVSLIVVEFKIVGGESILVCGNSGE